MEACRQYTHLDGQLNLALHTILAPDATTIPAGDAAMGCHSPSWVSEGMVPPISIQWAVIVKLVLHAPGMPKIAGEGGVGVLPCFVLT